MSPVTDNSVIELESSWSSSENMASTSGSALTESFEQDTGDSRATKATKVCLAVALFFHDFGSFLDDSSFLHQ